MTDNLQALFQAAGEQYARRLDEQTERARLDALAIETRHERNAQAFADAVALAFHDGNGTTTEPTTDPTPTPADDLMAAIAADTNTKEHT